MAEFSANNKIVLQPEQVSFSRKTFSQGTALSSENDKSLNNVTTFSKLLLHCLVRIVDKHAYAVMKSTSSRNLWMMFAAVLKCSSSSSSSSRRGFRGRTRGSEPSDCEIQQLSRWFAAATDAENPPRAGVAFIVVFVKVTPINTC